MLKLLLVVVVFALATYVAVRLIERRGLGGGGDGGRGGTARPSRPSGPAAPPRPLGPDDDPDFLRDLDRKRRHPEDPDA